MTKKENPISFRLSDDKLRMLRGMAAASGSSPGDLAREIVLERLDEQEITRRELDSLRAEFRNFQKDFAAAIEGLLVASSCGKPVSAEQARRWVDERIRSKNPNHRD